MVSDPIGDFIVRLKNAAAVGHTTCSVPHSKLKQAVAEKLKDAGFLTSVAKKGKKVKKTLEVELAYADGSARIRGVQRVSKPGRRLYTKSAEAHPVKFGTGVLVLSTPNGILTDSEARQAHVGGEQMFKIW